MRTILSLGLVLVVVWCAWGITRRVHARLALGWLGFLTTLILNLVICTLSAIVGFEGVSILREPNIWLTLGFLAFLSVPFYGIDNWLKWRAFMRITGTTSRAEARKAIEEFVSDPGVQTAIMARELFK